MTKTLQQKIDAIWHDIEYMDCIREIEIDKALQEFREELILEKNITKKFASDSDYNRGKLDVLDEVLALIGEKKE